MEMPELTMAEQIAFAASHFEQKCTGHGREWVTVFLNEDTMAITLHAALTAAERALAQCPAGAAQVLEFHRQLFTDASTTLWRTIKRISGMDVRSSTARIETTTGTVVQVFMTNTKAHEFLLVLGSLTRHPERPTRALKPVGLFPDQVSLGFNGRKAQECITATARS